MYELNSFVDIAYLMNIEYLNKSLTTHEEFTPALFIINLL